MLGFCLYCSAQRVAAIWIATLYSNHPKQIPPAIFTVKMSTKIPSQIGGATSNGWEMFETVVLFTAFHAFLGPALLTSARAFYSIVLLVLYISPRRVAMSIYVSPPSPQTVEGFANKVTMGIYAPVMLWV